MSNKYYNNFSGKEITVPQPWRQVRETFADKWFDASTYQAVEELKVPALPWKLEEHVSTPSRHRPTANTCNSYLFPDFRTIPPAPH